MHLSTHLMVTWKLSQIEGLAGSGNGRKDLGRSMTSRTGVWSASGVSPMPRPSSRTGLQPIILRGLLTWVESGPGLLAEEGYSAYLRYREADLVCDLFLARGFSRSLLND